ncbi:MAG: GNAT family N-acetyltransferase [Terriglobales bacterium]|jgi:predicted GNAT superfamily acetyltransferase
MEIRNCETLDEMRACVGLQKEVWNFSDLELVPLRLFVVARKIGGQVIGAFENNELVGFALSFPGHHQSYLYLHSHMLAVRQSYRNRGLGRALKLFQWEDALRQGIELIEWTFDPLEIKNAWLNLERLGAICRRYVINQYGITSSPLQGGLPSDRFVAEWWLKSKRVETTLRDGRHPEIQVEHRVRVPAQIYEWKADPAKRAQAAEVQLRNREALTAAFANGLAVIGYERDAAGNGTFLLGRWEGESLCAVVNRGKS